MSRNVLVGSSVDLAKRAWRALQKTIVPCPACEDTEVIHIGKKPKAPTFSSFRRMRARHRSLHTAIKAGKYPRVDPWITEENFGINGIITVNAKLVLYCPHEEMQSHKVLEEIKKQGLQPATLAHLLAFGRRYPQKQVQYRITAPGSGFCDRYSMYRIPILGTFRGERELGLTYWVGFCDPEDRFLAAVA